MKPAPHALAGSVLGGVWFAASGDGTAALTAAAAHVLLDLDHLVEHLFQSDNPFSLRTFLGSHNSLAWKRMVFFLHGYEWALALWAGCWAAPHPILFAVATGVTTHLLLDEIGNRLAWAPVDLDPGFYFFSRRLGQGFLRSRLTRWRPGRSTAPAAARES